jgi:hypothetical protein
MSIAVQSKKVGSTTSGLNPLVRMISGANVTKNYGRSLQRVFVLGRPLQPSLIFGSMASYYPSVATSKCSTLWLAPGLTHTHLTRVKRPERDKNSSLLQTLLNWDHNKFYKIGARAKFYKKIFCNLRMLVMSHYVCLWQAFTALSYVWE